MKTSLITIFLIFQISIFSYKIDTGSYGREFHFGKTYFENLDFLLMAHQHIKNYGWNHFVFESKIGINQKLITQDTSDPSYKNIYAGVTIGNKIKYMPSIFNFIPEIGGGITFNIISNNISENDSLLSFFLGIQLSTGIVHKYSDSGGYGFKFQFDIGYNTFIDKGNPRELITIISITFLSIDYYE